MAINLIKPYTHIHVGSNTPGYLPESDVVCFDNVDDALEALRHEIKAQQEYYWQGCEALNFTEGCECDWCDVAGDCEGDLGLIADGDAAYSLNRGYDIQCLYSPPEGPDIHHWASLIPTDRESCEIAQEQED